MNQQFFFSLTEHLPLHLTAVTPEGGNGLTVTYHDPLDGFQTMDIVRHRGGFTVSRQGLGEYTLPGAPEERAVPAWSGLVHGLRGLVEFPATDRMFWAIGEADLDLAVEALDDGADVHATNYRGLLPLDALAISLGCRADVIRLTFSRQAEPRGGSEGRLADILRELDALALMRLALLQAGAVDQSAFRDAVRTGDFGRAGAELEAGASVNAITLNRLPLLVERILHRDEPGVAWLLGAGADRMWHPPVGEVPRPVFLFEALPDLPKKLVPGLVLSPQTAAQVVGFPWDDFAH